jgi:hypothetical protein
VSDALFALGVAGTFIGFLVLTSIGVVSDSVAVLVVGAWVVFVVVGAILAARD